MQVHFHAMLRDIVGGRTIEVPVEPGQTVHELIQAVIDQYPAMHDKFYVEDDTLASSIHIFVNGRNVLWRGGLEARIPPDARINVFPPIGGG